MTESQPRFLLPFPILVQVGWWIKVLTHSCGCSRPCPCHPRSIVAMVTCSNFLRRKAEAMLGPSLSPEPGSRRQAPATRTSTWKRNTSIGSILAKARTGRWGLCLFPKVSSRGWVAVWASPSTPCYRSSRQYYVGTFNCLLLIPIVRNI